MQFILHVTCSCISHAYVLSFQYIWFYWCCLGLFWLFFFLSLYFCLQLVMSMAPKRKSTPAQNPLHFGASSSSDPSPSNVRFSDDDAIKAFSENFFRWGIHSKRQVVLSDTCMLRHSKSAVSVTFVCLGVKKLECQISLDISFLSLICPCMICLKKNVKKNQKQKYQNML